MSPKTFIYHPEFPGPLSANDAVAFFAVQGLTPVEIRSVLNGQLDSRRVRSILCNLRSEGLVPPSDAKGDRSHKKEKSVGGFVWEPTENDSCATVRTPYEKATKSFLELLAAHHTYGAGELNITPDGHSRIVIPMQSIQRSMVGSTSMMCMEANPSGRF